MYIHNVPAVFYNYNPLINYINKIIDFGFKDINCIPQNYKDEIVALIMECLGDDQTYVVFDTDDFSNHCEHLKNFIRSLNLNDAYKFALGIKKTAFIKYKDYIESIFDYLAEQRSAA